MPQMEGRKEGNRVEKDKKNEIHIDDPNFKSQKKKNIEKNHPERIKEKFSELIEKPTKSQENGKNIATLQNITIKFLNTRTKTKP